MVNNRGKKSMAKSNMSRRSNIKRRVTNTMNKNRDTAKKVTTIIMETSKMNGIMREGSMIKGINRYLRIPIIK